MKQNSKNTKLLEYFKSDELAAGVWLSKYAQEGEITPDDMHKRMAKEFARVEDKYQDDERRRFIGKIEAVGLSNYATFREPLTEESIYQLFKDFKYVIPQGSIMSQLGSKSIGSLSNCFRGDVKVLTRQGWREIKELENTKQNIMTKGGGWVEAPFKSYGEQRLSEVVLSNGYQEKRVWATEGHRWAIYKQSKPDSISKIKTTSELIEGDILYATYGKMRRFKLSSVGVSHGITYGDGHTVKGSDNCNNITLCSESRPLGIYFPESYVSSDENLCEGGSDFYSGLPNYFRDLPNIYENKSYLYGWLAGYFAADGHIDKRGSVMINSSKVEDLLFVKDVCGVLGIGCGEVNSQTVVSNLTNRDHTMYKVVIHKNHLREDFFLLDKHSSRFNQTGREPSRWVVKEVFATGVIEKVYCAEVPKTESFVVEGNILSMNCFVIGSPEDSYGGIFEKDEQMVQLMKRRGGVGIDISTLRPHGTKTSNAAKTSTGAISFMDRYSNTTREVAQEGRRGALLISIKVEHPDVMEFIKIKRDLTQVTGANISIKISDKFMKAVDNDEDFILRFPCDRVFSKGDFQEHYNLTHFDYNINYTLSDGTIIKHIKAKEYWEEIIKSAHGVAEPGLMFWDSMVNYSPDGVYSQFKPVTTNPCSELAMQPFDACRLIAVNLFSFVDNPYTSKAKFNFTKFYEYNYEAMRLSDDLIDLELEHIDRIINKINNDPEPEDIKRRELELWKKIKATATASRRTGLGFTALGDTLAGLQLEYGSDESLVIIEKIMKTKMRSELDCTTDLAIIRGTFKGWDPQEEFIYYSRDNPFIGRNSFYEFLLDKFPIQAVRMNIHGRRNVSWSTVAPTGSVSLLAQVTSGIEPLFQPFYMRRKKVNSGEDVRVDFTDDNGDTWQEFPVLHEKFKEWMKSLGVKPNEELTEGELDFFFRKSPWYKSTAEDIDWKKRVEIQSIIQKYISHSISSTINLPSDVSVEEVSNIYLESYKKGLKGITVYRDGSRSGVLINPNSSKDNTKFTITSALKRPKQIEAEGHTTVVNKVKLNVVVGLVDGSPYEVFVLPFVKELGKGNLTKVKKGSYDFKDVDGNVIIEGISSKMTDEQAAITRLVSTTLRHRTNIKFVVEQLTKCDGDLFSFTKGLVRVLKKYIPDGEKSTMKCSECESSNVIFEEGCSRCLDCGSSKCG